MASLEDITNRGIAYESLSPSIFRFLEIRKLSIFDKAAPENQILSIRKLKIYYRLRALLSGMFNEAVSEEPGRGRDNYSPAGRDRRSR